MDEIPLPDVHRVVLPNDLVVPPYVLELCTRQMAIENCVLPVDCSAQTVLLAMHDPTNIEKIDMLRFVLNRNLRILHVDKEVLQRLVLRHYS